MKIIDAFSFFNEIDLLKIRLELLWPHVDYFIICESNVTHSGIPKPYNFDPQSTAFKKYSNKIIHLKFEPDISSLDFKFKDARFNPDSPSWKLETSQRNHISTCLTQFQSDDVVIISDADEIWNPELATLLRESKNLRIGRLEQMFHYYYLNCRGVGKYNSQWTSSYFCRILELKNFDLSFIRVHGKMGKIGNAGWHFSYLGGVDSIITKIESFAHQELNKDEIKSRSNLINSIELGIDYLGRAGHDWAFHPIDYYPPKLAGLMRENLHLVKLALD